MRDLARERVAGATQGKAHDHNCVACQLEVFYRGNPSFNGQPAAEGSISGCHTEGPQLGGDRLRLSPETLGACHAIR